MTNWRGMVGWIAVGTALTFFLPAAALHILKRQAGEYSAEEIVERQTANRNLLYLSGLDQNVVPYKMQLTERLGPDVVVFGSSRAMQVRANFFDAPMVNWGGAVNSLAQFDWAANYVTKLTKKPTLVVIFVDTWWFNENFQSSGTMFTPRERTPFTNLYSDTRLLLRAVLRQGVRATPVRTGIAAIRANQGYDAAGSFHYVGTVFYPDGSETDEKFQETLKYMTAKSGRWIGGSTASDNAINRFRNIVKRLEAAGIKVVAIMPPFADPVTARFADDPGYRFVGDLRSKLSKDVLDFTEVKTIPGANHCEFIDGSHAGEVVYARVLLLASKQEPALGTVLSLRLPEWIERNAGKASPSSAQYAANRPELDFLNIGCKR